MSEPILRQGKKFAADFERIDEVKGNDRILIWDSKTSTVMFATPSQINAKFDQLVADIAAAIAAKNAAEAAQVASEKAQTAAAGSATEASGSADEAETFKEASQVIYDDTLLLKKAAERAVTDASAVLASSILKEGDEPAVIAAFIASLASRIGAIENSILNGFTSLRVENLTVRNALSAFLMGGNFIVRGNSAPAIIPDFVGQEYIDETNKVAYKAVGNNAVSDWKQITQ